MSKDLLHFRCNVYIAVGIVYRGADLQLSSKLLAMSQQISVLQTGYKHSVQRQFRFISFGILQNSGSHHVC